MYQCIDPRIPGQTLGIQEMTGSVRLRSEPLLAERRVSARDVISGAKESPRFLFRTIHLLSLNELNLYQYELS